MSTFSLEMLPAGDGDCILLSWGEEGSLRHMVVDGGRAGAYTHLRARLVDAASAGGTLELYVLTHVDADHISGALAFMKDARRPLTPRAVWFNGYRQVVATGARSMRQGDDYSDLLRRLEWPLNSGFERGVVSVGSAPALLDVGGLRLTLLSPDQARLDALAEAWRRHRLLADEPDLARRAGMRGRRGADFEPIPDPLVVEDLIAAGPVDAEVANGSSIAFVAEYRGRRILLAGDAHPDVLERSLAPLAAAEGGRYRVDLLKAPHHGSARNTTRRLVELIDCRTVAYSTNGNLHGHPDPEAVARFVHYSPAGPKTLIFNYETDRTRPWGAERVRDVYGVDARYPRGEPGVSRIDLIGCDLPHGLR
jgi:beta-lactamase superfamily II metal-dependent hydrolase